MVIANNINDSEKLYRVVKRSKPECISVTGKPSPALFKDTSGVSVDRDSGRSEDEVVLFILNKTFKQRTKAIGVVPASFCFSIDAEVIPDPSEINPYHANIWLDREDEEKRNIQALKLADKCRIVFENNQVEWI